METLRQTDQGVILPVKVIPKASKEQIVGWQDDRLKIKVCAPPEKGEANRAVVRLLSKTLNIPQNRIVLLRGETSRLKEFLLVDCTLDTISIKLK